LGMKRLNFFFVQGGKWKVRYVVLPKKRRIRTSRDLLKGLKGKAEQGGVAKQDKQVKQASKFH